MFLKKIILITLVIGISACNNSSEKQTKNRVTTENNTLLGKENVIEDSLSEEEKELQKGLDSVRKTRLFKARGMKMHHIDPSFTKKDLFGFYGKERLKEAAVYRLDGMDVMGTEVTFETPADNFTIEWNKQEGLESTPRTIRISNKNASWKTENGIGMGSSIEEVEAANGTPFSIYGFEINDYISGMSKNWGHGNLGNISLRFAPSNNIDPEIYAQLKGKNGILSNDPLLKQAGLTVDFIAVHFQRCNEGIYATEFCIAQLDFLPPEPNENLRGKDWAKVNLWENTQAAEVYFAQNSTLYDYGSHIIKESPQAFDSSVKNFTIYNRTTQQRHELGYEDFGYFFVGVVNDLVIIDSGTGSSREFLLYDITTGKRVFKQGYYNAIALKGDVLTFEIYAEVSDENRPECPQELLEKYGEFIGYVEIQTYNTKTKVYTATEVYQCRYME